MTKQCLVMQAACLVLQSVLCICLVLQFVLCNCLALCILSLMYYFAESVPYFITSKYLCWIFIFLWNLDFRLQLYKSKTCDKSWVPPPGIPGCRTEPANMYSQVLVVVFKSNNFRKSSGKKVMLRFVAGHGLLDWSLDHRRQSQF